MNTTKVQFHSIPGTAAAMGWVGGHSIVADRPAGVAGGEGIGFSGGQLLGLAIGGCFCNALQHVAHQMGVRLATVGVEVTVSFSDNRTSRPTRTSKPRSRATSQTRISPA